MIARYGEAVPHFLECSAKMSLQRAKDQFELLLVYVHSELHQDTDAFMRYVSWPNAHFNVCCIC